MLSMSMSAVKQNMSVVKQNMPVVKQNMSVVSDTMNNTIKGMVGETDDTTTTRQGSDSYMVQDREKVSLIKKDIFLM